MQKLPNYLTFMRILVILGVVASFSFPGMFAAWVGCGLFIAASITDWFDGYLARKFKSTSSLGRIFDPIADKLLVAATLLMMAAYDRLGYTVIFFSKAVEVFRRLAVAFCRKRTTSFPSL